MIDTRHDVRWIVADMAVRAPVLLRAATHTPSALPTLRKQKVEYRVGLLRDGRHIEHAVAESAEADGRVADLRVVGEGDAQEAEVVDEGRRDGGEEQAEGGDEEEQDADPERSVSE